MTFHVRQKLLFDHSKCLSSKKEATIAEKSNCLNQPADIVLMAMVIIVSWPAAQKYCWRRTSFMDAQTISYLLSIIRYCR